MNKTGVLVGSLTEQEFHIIFLELTTIYCAYIAQGVIE